MGERVSSCVDCSSPLPDDQRSRTCSMCYGDIDHGKDGYYRDHVEAQQRQFDEGERMESERMEGIEVPEGLHAELVEQGVIVSLKPGDKIVLICRDLMTQEMVNNLKERAISAFGTDQIVILANGMQIGVLRTEDQQA